MALHALLLLVARHPALSAGLLCPSYSTTLSLQSRPGPVEAAAARAEFPEVVWGEGKSAQQVRARGWGGAAAGVAPSQRSVA